jgi:biotin synthase-like enzyme
MFESAKELNLQRAMTFIVGMGETRDDLKTLIDFIKKYDIAKIHVYGLIPQKGTMFENTKIPSPEEQAWWIANLRINFPTLDIQCGVWEDRADRIALLLNAGANSLSKFKAIKLFGTPVAKEFEHQAMLAHRTFKGTLTKLPDIDWSARVDALSFDASLKQKVKQKLLLYTKEMKANCSKIAVISR